MPEKKSVPEHVVEIPAPVPAEPVSFDEQFTLCYQLRTLWHGPGVCTRVRAFVGVIFFLVSYAIQGVFMLIGLAIASPVLILFGLWVLITCIFLKPTE